MGQDQPRHQDTGGQGDVPDDGRVRRVRASHRSGRVHAALKRAKREGKRLGRPRIAPELEQRTPCHSWKARRARDCQAVRHRSGRGTADQPPFRRRRKRRVAHPAPRAGKAVSGDFVPHLLQGRLLGLTRVVFFVDVGHTPSAIAVELQHNFLIGVDIVLHAGRYHKETARRQWIGLALVRTRAFS